MRILHRVLARLVASRHDFRPVGLEFGLSLTTTYVCDCGVVERRVEA